MRPGPPEGAWACLLAAALCAACAASLGSARELRRIQPVLRTSLRAPGAGVPDQVAFTLSLASPDAMPLTVVGRRRAFERGDDAVLELVVRTEDFSGRGPVVTGRSRTHQLPFGDDGEATATAPLVRAYSLPLPPSRGALARRVTVAGRLFPVDLLHGQGRAGGSPLRLPSARLETAAPAPEPSLEAALAAADGRADAIFLAAVSAPPERRPEALRRLVGSLDDVRGPGREGIFAALLYLTGEPFGRSARRWQQWSESRPWSEHGR